ncbi:hypothetical protein HYT17_00425 [Candidatus Microgenomates bacterium]|nr:hypothetical protein [Candidatus Microgenomates bacterium]
MKKVIGIISGTIFPLFIPAAAFAQKINPCPTGDFAKLCFPDASALGNLVGTGFTLIIVIAVLLALGYLIWGGIKWVMSGGDKTALEEARNHIVAAIIGLVIIFIVYLVLNILLRFFIGKGIGELELPSIK